MLWSVPLPSRARILTSSPILDDDGNVYFGTYGPSLHSFKPSGEPRWTFAPNAPRIAMDNCVRSPAVITRLGLLHFSGTDGAVYAVNAVTGRLRWRYEVPGSIGGSPVMVGPDNTVYTGMLSLYVLDGETGRLKWIYPTPGQVSASPALLNTHTLVFASEEYLYAVDTRSRSVIWVHRGHARFYNSSPAIGPDGTVYIGDDRGGVSAVDGYSGRLRWRFGTADRVEASPAVSRDGRVYVGSFDGSMYALECATGKLAWSFRTGSVGDPTSIPAWITSSALVDSKGRVYFGSLNGCVYALNGLDGKVVWTIRTSLPVACSPAMGIDGSIYFGSDRLWRVR